MNRTNMLDLSRLASNCFAFFISLIFYSALLHGQDVADSLTMFDFDGKFDVNSVRADGAEASLVPKNGNQALVVESSNAQGGIYIVLKCSEALNLNSYHHVKVDVTNLTDQPAQLVFQVGSPRDGMEAWQMQIVADFEPGESKTIANPITTTPWVFSKPTEIVGMRAAPGQPKTDLKRINQVSLSFGYRNARQKFSIDNVRATNPVRLVSPEGYLPFVDKFGQYKHAHWLGKTLSQDDLRQQARELAANPGPSNLSKFGGWKDGPKFEATGFFRPQKHAGVWWLVDPEGNLFWSHGVGVVSTSSATTSITDRENYFASLPEVDSQYRNFFGTADGAAHGYYKGRGERKTFNFTGANLLRKYGNDWAQHFNDVTHARLRSWGMNTLGVASAASLFREQKTPYVQTVWVPDTEKIAATNGYWGPFHDVFHPSFRKSVKESLAKCLDSANDPWCIGYFIENELSWGGDTSLSMGTLASPADQTAKQVFIDDLKEKYGTIKKLNESWGTKHDTWQALLESKEKPDVKKARQDLMAFDRKIVETYFSTVYNEIKATAPNNMYMGCRLA